MGTSRAMRLIAVPEEGDHHTPLPGAVQVQPKEERRTEPRHPRPHAVHGPRFLSLDRRLSLTVGLVSALGVAAGVVGLTLSWTTHNLLGLLTVLLLVGVGQALALEADEGAAVLSVSAVGCLAASSLFGWRAALPLAITSVAVDWSARRHPLHNVLFNVGALTLATLTAASIFRLATFFPDGTEHRLAVAGLGLLAGAGYFAVNMGLVSLALALQGHERWWSVFREQFAWLLPHYVVYGFVGGVMALAYEAVDLLALAVFAVPLLLMRKTQEAYLKHTQRSAQKLRQAAETIQSQNVSLEMANKLLKERSTAAMESLSATVDARDSYTAGHSRRVQQLALAIGRELGLSQAELDLLGHAALFHDIGKLAIPDAILLKPASLSLDEWDLMQRHADEGARIIDRLGFLNDAVPAGIDREALAAFQAGIRKRYSDEQILEELAASAKRLGRSPTMREFADDPETSVHPQTVIEHFGSWNEAKRKAGLVPRRFATREELLELLKELGGELGRIPTARDIEEHRGRMPSKSLYWHTFGSLANALREAGFDVPVGEEKLERALDQGVDL